MATDLRTTVTNTGYLVVGVGVVGAQQARVGADSAAERLTSLAGRARNTAVAVGQDAKARVTPALESAKHLVEPTFESLRAQSAGAWQLVTEKLHPVRDQARERVEPAVTQLRSRVEPAVSGLRERIAANQSSAAE